MYLAYVYKLTHKITKEYYYGYRSANIELKLQSVDDLGIHYFTSSTYITESNFGEYNAEIVAEFFNPDDAYDHEQNLIREHWKDPLLLNRHFVRSGLLRFKINDNGKLKLKKQNTGKKWFNNGNSEKHAHTCPEGYFPGRLCNPFPNCKGKVSKIKGYSWYTDGTNYTMAKECPLGWVPGKAIATTEVNNRISQTMKNGAAAAKGKKWYTDGIESVLLFTCPPGWRPGHSNQQVLYKLTNPDGVSIEIRTHDLKRFCQFHKLRYGSILATGKNNCTYRGYTATKIS